MSAGRRSQKDKQPSMEHEDENEEQLAESTSQELTTISGSEHYNVEQYTILPGFTREQSHRLAAYMDARFNSFNLKLEQMQFTSNSQFQQILSKLDDRRQSTTPIQSVEFSTPPGQQQRQQQDPLPAPAPHTSAPYKPVQQPTRQATKQPPRQQAPQRAPQQAPPQPTQAPQQAPPPAPPTSLAKQKEHGDSTSARGKMAKRANRLRASQVLYQQKHTAISKSGKYAYALGPCTTKKLGICELILRDSDPEKWYTTSLIRGQQQRQ